MLPDALRADVETAVSYTLGNTTRLARIDPVGGGCISQTARVSATDGAVVFLKWARRGELPAGIFAAEADALSALRAASAVRVPAVFGRSATASQFDWLLLEWLEPARLTRSTWHALGAALALLHRSSNHRFGWRDANFIGSLPQTNGWNGDWPSFWRSERLQPQLEIAARAGELRSTQLKRFDLLLGALDDLLAIANTEGPSLLHGDLWNGNVLGCKTARGGDGDDGVEAALVDPSIYYGHREVDLAMARLFGGFDASFFEAYEEAWPQESGSEQRKLVYQLYYLLVHVNLFGGSYVQSALSAVGQLGF